ncbi:related to HETEROKARYON incompatibility protein [Fusarium proliferatum]|nr:related to HETEROKARYON incompatibility protein [Fusarium proliferatum]
MAPCLYSPLPEGSIRLLRITPHPDKNSPIQCELFNFSLSDSESTYPYEALSYVWGSAEKPLSIFVNDLNFLVGTNLNAALVHLRHGSLQRIIWIDAICINQGDTLEKGQQVQSMAEIYAKASCVVVWLGSASTTSDQTLDNIREAALRNSTEGKDQKRIFQLLQRPWFQRIWVLQEVAAARYVLIKCGSAEIDGYAFCSGLNAMELSYKSYPSLQPLVRSVTYLIRGAIFRPRHVTTQSSRFSLDIRPLSELAEMYHTRKATERHDKVYALLGMSSDDPSEAGLYVDYTIPWSQVFHRLVKYVLSQSVSVKTWSYRELAVIDGKGLVLGEVSSVQRDPAWEDSQEVTIAWKNAYVEAGRMSSWAVQASAKNIQAGDIVCILQGASRPTIIRLCHPYWAVVMISVPPTDSIARDGKGIEWSEILQSVTRFSHRFVLVWDWEMHPNESLGDQETKYEELMVKEMKKGSMTDKLYIIAILANIGFVLQDLERPAEAEKYVRRSLRNFDKALKNVDNTNPALNSGCSTKTGAYVVAITEALLGVEGGWLPLRWASEDGYDLTIKLMLENVDPNKQNEAGQTPLSWASSHGYEALVNLLLGIEIVDPDAKDEKGWTPLLWAASKGHEAIVKLLLDTKKVDPNAKEKPDETRRTRRTPLLLAAEGGHEAVVRMLLDTNTVDLSASAETGEASLLWAVKNGHAGVVQLLLQTGKIVPDAAEVSEIEDESGRTPLMWAANNQHRDVVKLLLDTGKVDLEARDKCRRTAISLAAENGNDEIVKLLLSTNKTDPDAADKDGRTPLILAAEGGFEKVVQLLLDTNKVNTSVKDNRGRTPLSSAAKNGHEAIVSMLAERNELSFQDLQRQILAPPKHEDFLNIRDEDYFDHRCQELFSNLRQWILRFSKFSDMRAARLTSEIGDEKIIDRLDNTILDGSDVDMYLCDRVRRRDVFTSVAMSMLWEFVFTRYLFGLDRETRQKLKSLEKQLVGPPSAIRRWRATTLTLLSNRDSVQNQRDHDARAVSETIFQTLCAILPPPSNLESQLVSSLSQVTKEAVEVSVEMRSQKAEYMMLPPLQPEYDANGDLASLVFFNAALMNERGDSSDLTNEEYEAQESKVRIVLFPLVVKKGGDYGDGDDEIVVYPAQVLVAPKRSEQKNVEVGS